MIDRLAKIVRAAFGGTVIASNNRDELLDFLERKLDELLAARRREMYRIIICDGAVSEITEVPLSDEGPREVVITLRPTDDPLDALQELVRLERRRQEVAQCHVRLPFDDKAGA